MKISLSGSNGFVGKLFYKYLKNYKICSIDRNNIIIDSGTNIVFHLAGIAHDLSSKYSLDDYMKSNYELTKRIYQKFIKSDADTFIFVSTSKVYGDCGIFDENTAVNPLTNYSKSKLKAEKYLMKKSLKDSKTIIILRPALIYSKTDVMKGNFAVLKKIISVLPVIIFPIIHNKKSYCSIENFFDLLKFLETNKLESGIYNISDSESFSTYSIVKKMSYGKIFFGLNNYFSIILLKIMVKIPGFNKIYGKLFNEYIVNNFKIKNKTGLSFNKKITE